MSAPPLITADAEKGITEPGNALPESSVRQPPHKDKKSSNFFTRFNDKVIGISFLEERGIQRVPEDARYKPSAMGYLQMALLWFSINVTANNLAVGLLGPLVYGLSFVDSALCAVFGGMLGGAGAAYISAYGPRSGNRTMVIARYFMGYYPSKICCLLNIIIMLGYGLIDCLIGGQILSAVSGGSLTVIVGIIIVALISWVVSVFGMGIFHLYERWAGLPQIIVLLILFGHAGHKFDTSFPSTGNPETINGDRLSFFSLCLSAPVAWAPSAADYYVYYPATTKPWKTFLMTFTGIALSFSIVYLLGVGLASGTFTHPEWEAAYGVSAGALILAGYNGLGGFGKFCSVVIAMGLVSNNIPGTYSAALGFQVLGRRLAYLPRWLWVCISVVIYTACALGGRNSLFAIFEDFLSIMGYWVTIFLVIVIEEDLIFRQDRGYDWTAWADRSRLPIGLAALTAFLIGWVGAIVSMDQTWVSTPFSMLSLPYLLTSLQFVGPIAKLIGEYGGDLGIWVGSGFALLVFPPLRWIELKKIGR